MPATGGPTPTVAPRSAAAIPARDGRERNGSPGAPQIALQRKLAIGAVNDPLEHEADRVAEQVMRMPGSATVSRGSPLQLNRKCAECEEEEKGKLQKKSAGAADSQTAPPIVHEVLASPGAPLDSDTRAFMEPRFGHDFGRVRVHSGAAAARSAQAVNALAYTVGERIVLGGAGASPRLLAHELAHVVQQGGGARPALRREQKTIGGPLDLKPNPCVTIAGHELCGQDAVSVCEKFPGFPGCSFVCQKLGCKKPDKPTTFCKPGSRAATSSDFAGQCCVGGSFDSAQNCCPPQRLAANPTARCCADDETVDPSTDTCIKVKDIPPAPPLCPPVLKTTVGTCCVPPMVASGPICVFPNLPKQPTPPPRPTTPLPQIGILWTDTIHFEQDHPKPAESDASKILTSDGAGELASVQDWLKLVPDLQVRLVAHASSEGETAYNQALSERRVNFIAGKVAGRLAEPIVPDTAAAGCISLGTGKWACGESMADQSKANANDRVVRVTFMRNTLPKLQLPPLQLPPKSTPGLGE